MAKVSQEPAGYREMVEDALREFDATNYEESRALFNRAHALYPSARTHRGLGFAEFELRNYGEAIRHLEAALNSSVKPLTPALKVDTERMLARANNFVARLKLDAKPGASRIVIDGVPVEVPADQSVLLQVGDHTLEIQAPGFMPEKRRLSVQGGEQKTLTIVLSPAAPAQAPPQETRSWVRSPWLWIGVGVVVAGAAAGTAVALTREDKTAPASGGSAGAVLKGP